MENSYDKIICKSFVLGNIYVVRYEYVAWLNKTLYSFISYYFYMRAIMFVNIVLNLLNDDLTYINFSILSASLFQLFIFIKLSFYQALSLEYENDTIIKKDTSIYYIAYWLKSICMRLCTRNIIICRNLIIYISMKKIYFRFSSYFYIMIHQWKFFWKMLPNIYSYLIIVLFYFSLNNFSI